MPLQTASRRRTAVRPYLLSTDEYRIVGMQLTASGSCPLTLSLSKGHAGLTLLIVSVLSTG